LKSLKERLAKNLQILRKLHGFSQAKLAELAGVSLQVVQRVETSTTWPDYNSIEAIAHALKVESVQLFDDPSRKLSAAREDVVVTDPRLKHLISVTADMEDMKLQMVIDYARTVRDFRSPTDEEMDRVLAPQSQKKKSR